MILSQIKQWLLKRFRQKKCCQEYKYDRLYHAVEYIEIQAQRDGDNDRNGHFDQLHDNESGENVAEQSHAERQRPNADLHNVERRDDCNRFAELFQSAAQTVEPELRAVDQQGAHDRQTGGDVQVFGRRRNAEQTGHVRQRKIQAYRAEVRSEGAPVSVAQCVAAEIVDEARNRWPLGRVTVIHRIGELWPGDENVFVGVTSAHRSSAFEAGQFIMDYLKTRAPFWKREATPEGDRWVEARESDQQAAKRW